MLDFRTETFLTVCKYLNYTKAAAALSITQPAVSQHIKYIEQEYGIKAFAFEGKKMQITSEGEKLMHALTTMSYDVNHLKEIFQSADTKTLSFGVTLTVGEYIIQDKIVKYLSKNPNVSFKMIMTNTSELLNLLDEGAIDIALVEGYYPKKKYDHLVFSKEKYIGVCSPSHVFKKKSVLLDELIDETLITREDGSGTREILERALEVRNYQIADFQNTLEISSLNVIKSFVEKDFGISFMYEAAVKKELQEGTLRKIKIHDFNVFHDISFIWRKNSMFSEEYHAVFDSII